MWCLRAVWFIALAVAGVAASTSPAQDWGTMPTISSTMGVNANRLCMGEASRGDIGCPTYAPSVTTAGDVSITGNVSAAKFIGDGSQLTGVTAASSDRITSGTTSFIVISDTGYISLTQANTNTGWFDPTRGLVTLGVSATGPISGTAGYFSSNTLVMGTFGVGEIPVGYSPNSIKASGDIVARLNMGASGGTLGLGGGWSTKIQGDATNKYLAFYPSGTEALRIVSTGYVGIGTVAPSATLHVNGNIRANNQISISNGSTPWLYMTNSTASVNATIGPVLTADAIAAGTSTGDLAIRSGSGKILFAAGGQGAKMAYTGSGKLGLDILSPTTALEVSGTVSATNFVGNGSGLTGLASGDRLVSGSVTAIAEQTSGTIRVSGTLALANSGNEACNASKHYSLRINPATGIVQMCRP